MANAFTDTEDPIEQLLKTADKVKEMSFEGAQKLEKLGVVDEKTIELMMKVGRIRTHNGVQNSSPALMMKYRKFYST